MLLTQVNHIRTAPYIMCVLGEHHKQSLVFFMSIGSPLDLLVHSLGYNLILDPLTSLMALRPLYPLVSLERKTTLMALAHTRI